MPGIDVDLDDDSWRMVGDQHPQHALKATLAALGVERDAVPLLRVEDERGRARRVLMREALAPAEKTADWLARLEAAGLKGAASGFMMAVSGRVVAPHGPPWAGRADRSCFRLRLRPEAQA